MHISTTKKSPAPQRFSQSIYLRSGSLSLLLTGTALSLLACSGEFSDMDPETTVGETAETKSDAITGGTLVTQDYFDDNNHAQSVVRFQPSGGGWCSGTKIGARRFLTAAHCVDDAAAGDGVDITNRLDGRFSGAGAYNVDIAEIYLHPTWGSNNFDRAYDIAIFDVSADTADIPTFDEEQFDHRFISDGMWGRLVAYGCDLTNPANGGRKQRGDFQAYSRSSSPSDRYYDGLYEHNITSYTPGLRGCPGDSGGPFIQERGSWRIIGVVNSRTDSMNLTNFTRIEELQAFLDDPASVLAASCETECNRRCTSNLTGSTRLDGVGDCIRGCIERECK